MRLPVVTGAARRSAEPGKGQAAGEIDYSFNSSVSLGVKIAASLLLSLLAK
jgi:hypothetical protein